MAKEAKKVREERSGWRDLTLSQRHREWGWDCPAVDLDFLLLEYDKGKASALVEYKHEDAAPVRMVHPTMRALQDLSDRAGLPALVVRYADDFSLFRVTPLNELAREWVSERTTMTEQEYVALLYRIRGRELPPDIISTSCEAV